MSIFEFGDQQGVRTRGTLSAPGATPGDVLTVGTSRGTVSPSPGGGSMPVQARYSGSPVTIADGDQAQVPWDSLDGGTELFDRTDPLTPVFLAAGTYAFTIQPSDGNAELSPGGLVAATFQITLAAGDINIYQYSIHPEWATSVTAVFQAAQGDYFILFMVNNDGAKSLDCSLFSAVVVKLA